MHRSIHRAAPASWGPFCARRVCDPRVSSASVWVPCVSPGRLRPPLTLLVFLSFLRVPRALEKLAARPLEPQQPRTMLFHGSGARRDLNLDNLTCTNSEEPSRYLSARKCSVKLGVAGAFSISKLALPLIEIFRTLLADISYAISRHFGCSARCNNYMHTDRHLLFFFSKVFINMEVPVLPCRI